MATNSVSNKYINETRQEPPKLSNDVRVISQKIASLKRKAKTLEDGPEGEINDPYESETRLSMTCTKTPAVTNQSWSAWR
jgi:ribosomal protein S10